MGCGDQVGSSLSQTRAEQSARRECEQRLSELIRLVVDELRIENVQPRVNPSLYVTERLVSDVSATQEQHPADGHVHEAGGRDVDHQQEYREEQQARTQVGFEEHHGERES